jgi:hypothetical protein
MKHLVRLLCCVAIGLTACRSEKADTLLVSLPADETGITFNNDITETDSLNILDFEYVYNGGGVTVADFNADGLSDLYFTGNMVGNRLYINKGDWKFEDVTQKSGTAAEKYWSQSAVAADVNADGRMDLYVCNTVKSHAALRRNLLLINTGNQADGTPTFTEQAQAYGLADTTHTANAAFFDYDKDGDLDVYLVTNQRDGDFPSEYRPKQDDGNALTTDRLYRADWDEQKKHPVYTNVSREAGILHEGYGHGIAISDINQDGWPDVYVTNDYLKNDVLYLNNGNGTFSNRIADAVKHQSFSAMGNDIADLNNDALPEIIALDMLPAANRRKRMMIGANNYQTYVLNEKFNYEYQYIRNTLQLHQGFKEENGRKIPLFSEVGFLAGIHETDWSWAPLLADFDNDGLRDVFISNGFPKDVTDHDFGAFRNGANSMFSSKQELIDQIPVVKIPNYIYQNQGDLNFQNKTEAWGLKIPSFSNGAAYADLDNDGDLDLVVNNIDTTAFVFRNFLQEKAAEKQTPANFLRIQLKGEGRNVHALGAKVYVYNGKTVQYAEMATVRGYNSCVENVLHFGLKAQPQADSVRVVWPSGKSQVMKAVKANQVLTLSEKEAKDQLPSARTPIGLLTAANLQDLTDYVHEEHDFIDFNIQKTLPHKFSETGPPMAQGDVNGDGLEDVFIGGAYQFFGSLFLQQPGGGFVRKSIFSGDAQQKLSEDTGCLLIDADRDQDLDLYIVSGGYEHEDGSANYQDRLYINDGRGNFTLAANALPPMATSKKAIAANDIDRDGDLDLFVGGLVVPGKYPQAPRSYWLRNDGTAQKPLFTDVSELWGKNLTNIGMIYAAVWADIDQDQQAELLLAGELMPLTVAKWNGQNFDIQKNTGLEKTSGWWRSLAVADLDKDGDLDMVAGNLGLNSIFKTYPDKPMKVYSADFDNNGSYDAFLSCYSQGEDGKMDYYPMHSRDDMVKQMIAFRRRFPKYEDYGKATFDQVFTPQEIEKATSYDIHTFQSAVLINQGGQFTVKALPMAAQIAPINALQVTDIDRDGQADILAVGNDYGIEVFSGRIDAAYGWLLKGDGKGNFKALTIAESGLMADGYCQSLIKVRAAKRDVWLVGRNRESIKAFEIQNINP